MEDCIFCKIINGQMPSQQVYEDADVLAFLDIRPINPGHTLVIPKRHSENFMTAIEEDIQKIVSVAKKITPAILKSVEAESCNFTTNAGRAAGQIVFHTHFHIIPRFPTDGYLTWSRDDDEHTDLDAMAKKIKEAIG